MRVLVVSRFVPWPLNIGAAQRTHAFIAAFARTHTVTLATEAPTDPALRAEAEHGYRGLVSQFIWISREHESGLTSRRNGVGQALRSLVDLVTHWTPIASRNAARSWAQQLRPHRNAIDAVFCRYSTLAPTLFDLGFNRCVVDFDDLQYLYTFRAARDLPWSGGRLHETIEAWRTWFAEQIVSMRASRALVCSSDDASRLIARRTSVVPNGVTLETGPRKPWSPDSLVFVGSCAWPPNTHGLRWFIENVWPRILAARPSTTLRIVGRGANYANLPFAKHDRIELAANVPSVKPWFESATASIVPVRFGGGTRIKIIESLGYGTPVISTAIGAEGLTDAFGDSAGLCVADDPATMANAVCKLLENPAAARANAERGAHIVAERFTWENIMTPVAGQIATWTGYTA